VPLSDIREYRGPTGRTRIMRIMQAKNKTFATESMNSAAIQTY
jgi:hypothetical protein